MKSSILSLISLGLLVTGGITSAQEPPLPVTVENFTRAESDLYFSAIVQRGGFGKFDHAQDIAPLDAQTVVRLNRDTLYSAAVFDLDAGPVTITVPDTAGRFISMQAINQDHYTVGVYYNSGDHTFDREKIGTRYLLIGFRILVDPKTPGDVEKVRAIQSAIKVKASPGKFEVPKWDQVSQKKVRDALLVLAGTLPNLNGGFGTKQEVDPIRHLLGSASAWGGNPVRDAIYLNVFPEKNDGKTIYRLTVKDVPVEEFWSISVYNSQGYYQKNDTDTYNINNLTAAKNADGSVTVQFGGQKEDAPNVLPVMPGWNYFVRLYRPAPEIISGEWQFPVAIESK